MDLENSILLLGGWAGAKKPCTNRHFLGVWEGRGVPKKRRLFHNILPTFGEHSNCKKGGHLFFMLGGGYFLDSPLCCQGFSHHPQKNNTRSLPTSFRTIVRTYLHLKQLRGLFFCRFIWSIPAFYKV